MDRYSLFAFSNEIQKIAATRYEREISAGNLDRMDVGPPGSLQIIREHMTPDPNVPGDLVRKEKQVTRDYLRSPVSDANVGRLRQIKEKQHIQQARNASMYVPGTTASTKIGPGIAATVPGGPDLDSTLGMFKPTKLDYKRPQVRAPEVSGQFLRGLAAYNPAVQMVGQMSMMPPQRSQIPSLLGEKKPVDHTLNQATLQHELGEAAEMRSGVARPHASHLGAEPILRENLSTLGDVEAQNVFKQVRQAHPDDALVQKFIARAGGTPNAPIPLHGRQHAAVNRMLEQQAAKLSPEAKMKMLTFDMARQFEVPGLPVKQKDLLSSAKDIVTNSSGRGRLQSAKDFLGKSKQLMKFVTK